MLILPIPFVGVIIIGDARRETVLAQLFHSELLLSVEEGVAVCASEHDRSSCLLVWAWVGDFCTKSKILLLDLGKENEDVWTILCFHFSIEPGQWIDRREHRFARSFLHLASKIAKMRNVENAPR